MGEKVVVVTKEHLPLHSALRSVYDVQLQELSEIRNPSASREKLEQITLKLSAEIGRVYIYYPWRKEVLETVPEAEFMEIKTNRNKLLITGEEQHKLYYETSIAIAGMSVGSSILFGCVGSGIARHFVIADGDTFSNSNLNRVQANVFDIGNSKAWSAYRKAVEMNPFLDIEVIDQQIESSFIDHFYRDGKVSIIFEEIDDFKMKVLLRDKAKEYKLPFVMLTNLGDAVQIDIEPYHTDDDYQPFHGLVSAQLIEELRGSEQLDPEAKKHFSISLVDRNLIPERAIDSLEQIGTTLVGRPQLYSTVVLDGGLAPFLVRKIILERAFLAGRHVLKFPFESEN